MLGFSGLLGPIMEAGPMRAIVEVKVAAAIYELRIHDDANQINEAVNEVVNEGEPVVNRDDEAVALFSAYVSELPSKSLLILGMCANQELTKRETDVVAGISVKARDFVIFSRNLLLFPKGGGIFVLKFRLFNN